MCRQLQHNPRTRGLRWLHIAEVVSRESHSTLEIVLIIKGAAARLCLGEIHRSCKLSREGGVAGRPKGGEPDNRGS